MHNSLDPLTRRKLIGHTLSVGAGIALGGFVPRPTHATHCNPPGTQPAPVAFSGDYRSIQPRRPATTLTVSEVSKLKAAYQALRNLQTSDPSDPRGYQHQANIHCYFCGGSHGTHQIHGSWLFFAWHRAELYFHERILGHLIGDQNFRLPYWSYENASHRRLPPAYVTPNDASNPLFNSTRQMDPTEELPNWLVGQSVIDNLMALSTFSAIGGSSALSGAGEGSPHGGVHVFVDGDMGAFATAGKDAIFYAHHGRIDKIWSDWRKLDPSHTDPTSATFLDLAFNFYDENKVWTSIKFSDVLDHQNQLRYTYGGPALVINPAILKWLKLRIKPKPIPLRLERGELRIEPQLAQSIEREAKAGKRFALHLEEIALPKGETGIFFLYANAKYAAENAGPGSPGYLGYTAVVPNSFDDPGNVKPLAVVDVTERLNVLVARQGATPQLVRYQRRRKGVPIRAAKPIPLVAERVALIQR